MSRIHTLTSLAHLAQPIDEYIWRFESGQPGPNVTILQAVHGNESNELLILRNLILQCLEQNLLSGSLTLAVGSPPAFIANKRQIHKNLNRCFDSDQTALPEDQRARVLEPHLRVDIMIDVHATINQTPFPFLIACVPDQRRGLFEGLLPHLGIEVVCEAPITQPAFFTQDYAAKNGALGITYETGWLQELDEQQSYQRIYRVLSHLGMFPKLHSNADLRTAFKRYHSELVIATPGFQFTKKYHNFEPLPANTVYATDAKGRRYKSPRDSLIVFPKDQIVPGQDACELFVAT